MHTAGSTHDKANKVSSNVDWKIEEEAIDATKPPPEVVLTMTRRPIRAGRSRCAGWFHPVLSASLQVVLVLVAVVAVSLAGGDAAVAAPDRRCSPPAYGLWRIWNWHEEAVWQLTSSRPRSLEVSNVRQRPGPGALTVAADISKCSVGAVPTVTLTLTADDGTVSEQVLPLAPATGRRSSSLLIPDFGGAVQRVLATAQLTGTGSARCVITLSFTPAVRTPAGEAGGAMGEAAPAAAGASGPTPVPAHAPAPAMTLMPLFRPSALPPPMIEVRRITRQTSSRVEDRTQHALWLWSFGDGIAYPVIGANNIISTQVHPFVTPGLYTVTARSVSNKGTLLRELSWTVIAPPPLPGVPPVPLVRVFSAETIREPVVRLKIDGPHKWVVGRPADFAVSVDFADPPHCNRESVLVDPGREFTVVWDKPGQFTVRVAAVIHLRYEFPERVVTIVNTYVTEQAVEVFATVSTD